MIEGDPHPLSRQSPVRRRSGGSSRDGRTFADCAHSSIAWREAIAHWSGPIHSQTLVGNYRFRRSQRSVRVVQDAIVGEGGRVEDVYRAESRKLWRALFAYSGDAEVASDALAEACARALRDEGKIRDLSAWLWRVSFRLAAAELRMRSRPTRQLDPPDYAMPEPVPELIEALRQLSPNQRLALVLHDYADRSTRDVARTLGCSQATVHVHLSKGRRRLRHLLGGIDE